MNTVFTSLWNFCVFWTTQWPWHSIASLNSLLMLDPERWPTLSPWRLCTSTAHPLIPLQCI